MKIRLKIRSITNLFLALLLTLICILGYNLNTMFPPGKVSYMVFIYLPSLLIIILVYLLIIWLFIESFELEVTKK